MKKTFFGALAAMLIFAVAGSGNVFAGGKLADNAIKEKAKVVRVHKSEKSTTKTVAVAGEKKMVRKHLKAHRISKKSEK